MDGIIVDESGNILYTKDGSPRKYNIYRLPKFKKRAGVKWSERKQGLIFYMCKNYAGSFTDKEKERFVKLCTRCSNGKTAALMMYLVSEMPVEDIVKEYNVSRTRLYEYTKEFYNNFEYVKSI